MTRREADRVCVVCSVALLSRRSDARTCSVRCRVAAHRDNVNPRRRHRVKVVAPPKVVTISARMPWREVLSEFRRRHPTVPGVLVRFDRFDEMQDALTILMTESA